MVGRRIARLARESIPSREAIAGNRFIRPVAHRVMAPELWRFTRRSVPRGVALGLLVGILLMIPGLQIAGAALLALPVRANVPVAAAMTFLSNPATTPFILAMSYYVGRMALGRAGGTGEVMALIHHHASIRQWGAWLFSETAPVMLFGLFVVSVSVAAVGYVLSAWLWRERMARKWRHRANHRAQPAEAASGDFDMAGDAP